jgi:PH domain
VLRPTRLACIRNFILDYKNEQEYELCNIIKLDTIHAIAPIEGKRPFAFGIATKERTYYLRAASELIMNEWISQLKGAIRIVS